MILYIVHNCFPYITAQYHKIMIRTLSYINKFTDNEHYPHIKPKSINVPKYTKKKQNGQVTTKPWGGGFSPIRSRATKIVLKQKYIDKANKYLDVASEFLFFVIIFQIITAGLIATKNPDNFNYIVEEPGAIQFYPTSPNIAQQLQLDTIKNLNRITIDEAKVLQEKYDAYWWLAFTGVLAYMCISPRYRRGWARIADKMILIEK